MESARGEKRRTPRIQPFVVRCRVVVAGRRLPAYLTDLSAKGGRIHFDGEPPAPESAIVIEVRIGRRVTHFSLPAVVKWSKPTARGGHHFGLSFEGLGPEEQKTLQTVVDDFRRRAAEIA